MYRETDKPGDSDEGFLGFYCRSKEAPDVVVLELLATVRTCGVPSEVI